MPNLLIHEKSPYLLEHAENPVDWQPFGDEAFALAAALDRPVFVSVGYMSCHWCHVMARESFENPEVAQALNARFVSVKVDREERPDVDAVCMRACQMLTGSGGWPLSVFMTPQRAPFFAGTYFPPRPARGQAGFIDLLQAIADAWEADRDALAAQGGRMVSAMRGAQAQQPGEMRMELVERCFDALRSGYDPEYGGFSRAPKFPTPHAPMFLMDLHLLTGAPESLDMAAATLRHMAMGGMFDQVGGGFCRYATDRQWLAPHFEKMLYDNALLLSAYARAFEITRDPLFADTAHRTLDYLLREMRSPEDGFYGAQDADSLGREGVHYLFSRAEVIELLGAPRGAPLCDALGIDARGNFEGLSIPNRLGQTGSLDDALKPARERLYRYRRRRIALRTDEKILTSWNALAISALAEASRALNRPDALDAALGALRFIDERLTGADGDLLAVSAGGVSKLPGMLDDYAFLCLALIRLYGVALDPAFMRRAEALLSRAHELFHDEAQGGYFLARQTDQLPVRPKEDQDNALPCGNSTMSHALLSVARWTDDPLWHERALAQMRYVAGAAEAAPGGNASAMSAGLMWLTPSVELVCATSNRRDARAFLAFVRSEAPANAACALRTSENLVLQPDWVRALPGVSGQTTYYCCQNGACSLPVNDLSSLARLAGHA